MGEIEVVAFNGTISPAQLLIEAMNRGTKGVDTMMIGFADDEGNISWMWSDTSYPQLAYMCLALQQMIMQSSIDSNDDEDED